MATSRTSGNADDPAHPIGVVAGHGVDDVHVGVGAGQAQRGPHVAGEQRRSEEVARGSTVALLVVACGPAPPEKVPGRGLVATPRGVPRRERHVDEATRTRHPDHLVEEPVGSGDVLEHVGGERDLGDGIGNGQHGAVTRHRPAQSQPSGLDVPLVELMDSGLRRRVVDLGAGPDEDRDGRFSASAASGSTRTQRAPAFTSASVK